MTSPYSKTYLLDIASSILLGDGLGADAAAAPRGQAAGHGQRGQLPVCLTLRQRRCSLGCLHLFLEIMNVVCLMWCGILGCH